MKLYWWADQFWNVPFTEGELRSIMTEPIYELKRARLKPYKYITRRNIEKPITYLLESEEETYVYQTYLTIIDKARTMHYCLSPMVLSKDIEKIADIFTYLYTEERRAFLETSWMYDYVTLVRLANSIFNYTFGFPEMHIHGIFNAIIKNEEETDLKTKLEASFLEGWNQYHDYTTIRPFDKTHYKDMLEISNELQLLVSDISIKPLNKYYRAILKRISRSILLTYTDDMWFEFNERTARMAITELETLPRL